MSLAKKGTDTARKLGKIFLDKQIDRFNKEYIPGSGITLTNNEIKDIVKVMKFLENRGILLKGTTRKITSQEGGFLNFLRPLVTAGLPLMKSVLTPMFCYHLDYQQQCQQQMQLFKKVHVSGTVALIISNEEMEDIMKIVKLLEKSGLLIQGISETIKNETK